MSEKKFDPKNSIFHPEHKFYRLIHEKPVLATFLIIIGTAAIVILLIIIVLSIFIVFRRFF